MTIPLKIDSDTLNAFVYKQNPEYKQDATLQLGSAIYLWLTVDSAKLKIDSTRIVFGYNTGSIRFRHQV